MPQSTQAAEPTGRKQPNMTNLMMLTTALRSAGGSCLLAGGQGERWRSRPYSLV